MKLSRYDESRKRFRKAAKRSQVQVERIGPCLECGAIGTYTETYRPAPRSLPRFQIVGTCPNGHDVERYGVAGSMPEVA